MKSERLLLRGWTVWLAASVCFHLILPMSQAETWQAKDLNPVTVHKAASQPPVVLAVAGQPKASIVVMGDAVGAEVLQKYIRAATGAELPIVKDKVVRPAIVIGDCAEAAAAGLVGKGMPLEGFAIKTAPDLVFIVGNSSGGAGANGVRWGVNEFLERFVGMRWYFPQAVEGGPEIGQDIPKIPTLAIPPVWIEDAPVFPLREMWPPCANSWNGTGVSLQPLQTFLRAGNSWPNVLVVHSPDWSQVQEFRNGRPEIFQLKADGTRDFGVLCYSNPKTVATYLEQIQNYVDGKPYKLGIRGKAISVSPADVPLACYCTDCRKLWDDKAGEYGNASKVLATFVDTLARDVKKRWPGQDFTILFLPYKNYTYAPEGFRFPGNVEVQICGMPGMAAYKEPSIRDSEQDNISRWIKTTGRKVQNWHYNCWPADKTKAAYQYPHVIKDFYVRNRETVVGSFINGEYNHWPRQNISLYCWLKCLWNPDFNVDAAVDEFCIRLFGPAAGTMRRLVGMQIDGWEKSRWPGGRLSPKGIYETSFPRTDVVKMEALFQKARAEAKADPLVTQRLDYYGTDMLAFFKESKELAEGTGLRPLLLMKVGEDPKLDGRLDDSVWPQAMSNSLVIATGETQGKPPKYPTMIRGVWTPNGVSFAFGMTEPTPDLLETKNGGHDNGMIWWDDCVEIFLDVTGKGEGEYYQIIINSDGAVYDSRIQDLTWECRGLQAKAFRGKDFWSLEVFIPYSAFPEVVKPGSGPCIPWKGNFMRHRVADQGLQSTKPPQAGSVREYTRMNTTGSPTSANMTDFAELRFVE